MVIAPENFIANNRRGDAFPPEAASAVGGLPQRPFHRFGFDRFQQRPRVQLAGGTGDRDVVDVAEVATGGKGLAEGGEGEGDGAPGLLGEGRRPHRHEAVVGPGFWPGDRRQPVLGGAPLDLGDPFRPLRRLCPGAAVEAPEQPAEQDRLPLRLLELGCGEEPADPLSGEVGVRGPEVVIEDNAAAAPLRVRCRLAYAWIAQLSTALAASRTASDTVGCGCTVRASSW